MTPRAFTPLEPLLHITSTVLLLTLGLNLPVAAEEHHLEPLKNTELDSSFLMAQVNWIATRPTDEAFTVEMPTVPNENTTTMLFSGDVLTWSILKAQVGSEFYALAYTDISAQVLDNGGTLLLEALKNNLLTEEFDWTAVGDRPRPLTLQGNRGQEYLGIQNGTITATRFYLVNQRLYALFIQSDSTTHVSHFFNSFEVASNWQPFFSEEGGFAAQMPETPSLETESMPMGDALLEWTLLEARNLYADPDLFVVAYADLPASESSQDSETLLDTVSQFILTDNNLQDLESSGSPVYLAGNPGRAFVGQRDGRILAIQVYLVDERIYTVFGRSEDVATVDWFLNSFELR